MKKGVYEAQQHCRKFRIGEKDWTPKTTILGVRVLFWKLACNQAYGAKVQRWYHARLMTKALLQHVNIPDTTAGIVTELKEAMAKWSQYSKVEAEEDRKTFSQKKAMAIAEKNNMMSSLCFKDFPALAISGMMMTFLFDGANNTFVTEGPMGKENR
jgi:hypothetical protein